jgi:hypothetical protein
MSSIPLSSPPREQAAAFSWPAVFLLTGVLALPVLATVKPVADWDVWWHLRTGQWIVDHGQVTTNDPFSAYGADRPWVAYSWLFEVLIYQLYQWLGLAGIIVYRVLMSVAVVVAFQRLVSRVEPRFLVSTVLSAVAAFAVFPLLNERPWLFTILFTTLTLDVLLDLRAGRRCWTFWALPFVYVLWANLHIQFVYGFLLFGIAAIAPLLDRSPAPSWRRLVALGFVCALATLVNPYHIHLYEVVIEYATQPGPYQVIDEIMAPSFRQSADWVLLGLVLATAFALGRKKDLSSFDVLFFIFTTVFWLRAQRDLWLVVLPALVYLPLLIPAEIGKSSSIVPPRGLRLIAAGLALLLALFLGAARGLTEEHLRQEEVKRFPARAAEVVNELGCEGPLYNHFNWGGYLIWKVQRLPVSMDGRCNLHGEERLTRSLNTWAGHQGWDSDPELAAARVVVAQASFALTSLLRRDPRFKVVYEDDRAVVFVRR